MKAVYTDSKSNQFFNVENLALKYYGSKEGWNGLHVENNLMKFLYGILFWDEIYYSKVPYVFQTAYQFGPLDFHDGDFFMARKEIIEKKLEKLESMERQEIKDYFTE